MLKYFYIVPPPQYDLIIMGVFHQTRLSFNTQYLPWLALFGRGVGTYYILHAPPAPAHTTLALDAEFDCM